MTNPDDMAFLTREEEFELARRARAGDVAARDRMFHSCVRVAYKFARKCRCHSNDRDDATQAALMALTRAVHDYDPRKCRLSTIATVYVKNALATWKIRMYGKWERIKPMDDLGNFASRWAAHEEEIDAKDHDSVIAREVRKAVAKLPKQECKIVRAIYLDPEPMMRKDYAAMIGISTTALQKHRSRAMKRLEKSLGRWRDTA